MLIRFWASPFPRTASTRMALTTDDIRRAAERLDQAEKTRVQIRQLSLDHPGITLADAYAIQKAWIEIKLAAGRVVKGHKIGLTSKAMQSALAIDEPDSGVLLDDMFFADPHGLALEAGQVVLAGSFIRPIETRKGDTIQADYGAYGTVSCYFA
jgi:2-keto-4-pentenoate hydratase